MSINIEHLHEVMLLIRISCTCILYAGELDVEQEFGDKITSFSLPRALTKLASNIHTQQHKTIMSPYKKNAIMNNHCHADSE